MAPKTKRVETLSSDLSKRSQGPTLAYGPNRNTDFSYDAPFSRYSPPKQNDASLTGEKLQRPITRQPSRQNRSVGGPSESRDHEEASQTTHKRPQPSVCPQIAKTIAREATALLTTTKYFKRPQLPNRSAHSTQLRRGTTLSTSRTHWDKSLHSSSSRFKALIAHRTHAKSGRRQSVRHNPFSTKKDIGLRPSLGSEGTKGEARCRHLHLLQQVSRVLA